MNFLAHFVIATRYGQPVAPTPLYVAGNALPDLLPLVTPRRLRASYVTDGAAIGAGVRSHLATDVAFHKTLAFAQTQAEVNTVLRRAGFSGIRVRLFFLSHILTELALDAVLLRAEPALADEFYGQMAAADTAYAVQWVESVLREPLPDLMTVLTRFLRRPYLYHYAQDAGVVEGLNRLCARAGQDTFEGENLDRLKDAAAEAISTVERRRGSLLEETALRIPDLSFAARMAGLPPQETGFSPVKTRAGIAHDRGERRGMNEKRTVQLHYPLERLTEPIVTRLVTDFDLEPNLLRADVDAQTGGWLVLELNGDTERIHTALDWLRDQGLVVTEAS